MEFIQINEVGPRDGLQSSDVMLSVQEKYTLIRALEKSGINSIEIGSFVNPRLVPSMAGTDELFQKLDNKVNYSVLIPNLKGFELARKNNIKEICLVLCVTDSMNIKNINKTVNESIKEFKQVIKKAREVGIRSKCYISVAFHCPYDGKVDSGHVIDIVNKIISYGIDEIVIADTIGHALPTEVSHLFKGLLMNTNIEFSAHFHDTKEHGLANVCASIEQGVYKFDSSIGGLGGCPFAPGSKGNLSTESLVQMLSKMNLSTGINLASLKEARELASKLTSLELQRV